MPLEPPAYFHKPVETCEVRFFSANSSNALAAKMASEYPAAMPSKAETKIIYLKTLPASFKSLPLSSMKLPIGIWEYERLEYSSPNGYNIRLTAKDHPQIELRFSSPGVYFTDETHFRTIISKKNHELSKEELVSIGTSDCFATAKTECIDGKQVIAKSGHYADDNLDVYQIEFNQNPDNSKVLVSARITFSALLAEYKQYLGEIQQALKSIKWKKKVTLKP